MTDKEKELLNRLAHVGLKNILRTPGLCREFMSEDNKVIVQHEIRIISGLAFLYGHLKGRKENESKETERKERNKRSKKETGHKSRKSHKINTSNKRNKTNQRSNRRSTQ